MQVDVIHLRDIQAGTVEHVAQRKFRADTLRVRRGHMVRIARLAAAEQAQRRVGMHIDAFEQRKARRFSDRNAAPRRIERAAWCGRYEFERVEAEQRALAQRIHAADDGGFHQAKTDEPFGAGKHFGAGRTGSRDGEAGAADRQRRGDERGQRVRRVDRFAMQRCRQAFAIQVPIA